jgi:hypothetical protein
MIALISQWKVWAAAGSAALLVSLFALWRLEAGHAQSLQAQLQQAQAAAKQAQAQSAAAADAETVIANGAVRDQHTVTVHSENSHAIQSAEGASQALDPGLNAAGRRGLCAYDSYAADPACVQLRGHDSGPGPPTGQPDAAASG